MQPDQICDEYASTGARITIRNLDDQSVLIEGNGKGLEFLGRLLIAQAEFSGDCGFEISPMGPGSLFFEKDSALGVHIHRLDKQIPGVEKCQPNSAG